MKQRSYDSIPSPARHPWQIASYEDNMFENIKADIARCNRKSEIFLNPALWAVLSYRLNRWTNRAELPRLVRPILRVVSTAIDLVVRAVLHVELPADADIGPGLYIPHTGCIVVGTSARIGRNCTLAHGVTVGHGRGGKRQEDGAPSIGNRVYVGPGAVIIGPVEIGDDALVGAGAVVVRSVPPAGVVAGNPSRLISRNGSFDLISYPEMERDAGRNAALLSFRLTAAPAVLAGE
jgi:serine O-acetyltransferase